MGKFEKKRTDAPQSGRSGEGSFIAAGCTLEGEFTFSGPLTIAGEIKGRVQSEGLVIIEEKGRLEGFVEAPVVIVHGVLSGTIRVTDSLEIWSGAKADGQIASRCVRVDEGAHLTADMIIAADLPPAVTHVAGVPAPQPAHDPEPVQAPANRPVSPLPGSSLARRLAARDDQ